MDPRLTCFLSHGMILNPQYVNTGNHEGVARGGSQAAGAAAGSCAPPAKSLIDPGISRGALIFGLLYYH